MRRVVVGCVVGGFIQAVVAGAAVAQTLFEPGSDTEPPNTPAAQATIPNTPEQGEEALALSLEARREVQHDTE